MSGGNLRPRITREQLVKRLADVSHATWMRQKVRDQQIPYSALDPGTSMHDYERAEDIVVELERMAIWHE